MHSSGRAALNKTLAEASQPQASDSQFLHLTEPLSDRVHSLHKHLRGIYRMPGPGVGTEGVEVSLAPALEELRV